jgi:hypothetical protein
METRTLYVDSTNRDTALHPKGSDFTLHLTDPVKNISRVDLVAARVPNTLYNLKTRTASLRFSGQDLSFNPGFYSTWDLATRITAQLPPTASAVYVASEGKFLITSASAFTLQVVTPDVAKLLGLAVATHSSAPCSSHPMYSKETDHAGRHYLTSALVTDTSTNEFIFLDIAELRTPGNIDAKALLPNGTYAGSSARASFGMIQMDVDAGAIKSFKEQTDYRMTVTFPKSIEKLSRLTIKWLDSDGAPLDFQGLENNSFVLRLVTSVVPATLDRPTSLPPPVDVSVVPDDERYVQVAIAVVLTVGLLVLVMLRRK